MRLSLVPLLLTNRDISPEARMALFENRLHDAAAILMKQRRCTSQTRLRPLTNRE